jgi:hypothetical protein
VYSRHEIRGLGSRLLRAVNNSMSSLDRLVAHGEAKDAHPVIVVGLPRSGTTLAYELLVQAFDVAFVTRMYGLTYGLPNLTTRLVSPLTRTPSARYESRYGRIPGMLAPAENHVLWSQWFDAPRELGHYVPYELIDRNKAADARAALASMSAIARRPFVFKNVYFTMCVSAILKVVPNAFVIVVKRDLESVCASVYRARAGMRDRNWWSIRPPFWESLLGKDSLEQTVFQCMRAQQLLNREIQRMPCNRYLVVDYKEICNAPESFVQEVEGRPGPTLQRRMASDIPERFERRSSGGLPAEIEDRFSHLCTKLSDDNDRYLRQVDERTEHYARLVSV